MGRCGTKTSRKATTGGQKSKRSMKCRKACARTKPKGTGRNPFFRFLAHFRKCNRDRLCHLPSRQVALMAGRQWTRMSPTKKQPFIRAARSSNYTYRPRSRKVNWLLAKLRGAMARECQAQALWMLMSGMKSWQECLLNEQDEESCLN